MLEALSSAHY